LYSQLGSPNTHICHASYTAKFSSAKYNEIIICVGVGKEIQIPYETILPTKLLPGGDILEVEFDFL
jgi:hypothetical protein